MLFGTFRLVPLISAVSEIDLDSNVPKRRTCMLGLHPKPPSTTTYPRKRLQSEFLLLYLLVGALGAVEEVHLLLLIRSRSAHVALVGVRLGVNNSSRLPEHGDSDAMPETDEECGGGGDQDIAVRWSVSCTQQTIGNPVRELGFSSKVTHTRIPGGCLRRQTCLLDVGCFG
jgi:hypothetical protein